MRTDKINRKTKVLDDLLRIQEDSKMAKLINMPPEPKKEKEIKAKNLPKSQERIFKPKKHDFF